MQLRVELEGTVLGAIELAPIDGRVSALAVRAIIAEGWAEHVLAHYLARHPEECSLATALWERDHPLVARFADTIDQLAAGVRGPDDGTTHRGPPRTMVVEAGHRVPTFIFGRRNIAAELRVAGRRAGSIEVAVGLLGVVSGRAVRARSARPRRRHSRASSFCGSGARHADGGGSAARRAGRAFDAASATRRVSPKAAAPR